MMDASYWRGEEIRRLAIANARDLLIAFINGRERRRLPSLDPVPIAHLHDALRG